MNIAKKIIIYALTGFIVGHTFYNHGYKNGIDAGKPKVAMLQDLNGDGIPDLVAYSQLGNKSVLIGQGNESDMFLSIDSVLEAKEDSLKNSLKSAKEQLEKLTK